MGKPKKTRRRAKLGLFTGTLLLVLIAALGWRLYLLRSQVEQAQTQEAQLAAQVQLQQQENDKLQGDLSSGGTQEQMEEIARNELGMLAPGDRLFYDVSN